MANGLEIIHRSIVVRRVDVIQWSEELYERILIDRTIDACKGQVDVVIDFGTTSRSLNRSIQCLSKGGVVFIGHETADRLMPKFARKAEEHHIEEQQVPCKIVPAFRFYSHHLFNDYWENCQCTCPGI